MSTLQKHRQKTSERSTAAKRKAPALIILASLLFVQISFSQTIKGIITGINNEPLFDASVSIERTNIGTSTETGEYFSIKAKKGDILSISYIGYITTEIKMADETFVEFSFSASLANLDDIVVTGHTSQKLKEVTGSIVVVKPKDLVAAPAGQIEEMLQGGTIQLVLK